MAWDGRIFERQRTRLSCRGPEYAVGEKWKRYWTQRGWQETNTQRHLFSTRMVQDSKQLSGNAKACWKRFSAAPFHSTGTRRCSHEKNMSAGDKLDYATAGADDLGAEKGHWG